MALLQNFINTFQMNYIAPVLLDVYGSWGNLDTMGTAITSSIYKGDKKYIANYRPISLLILKNQIQKILVTIIVEHQSEAFKK